MPSYASKEPIHNLDPHPLATAILLGGIALAGAVLFAGSIWSWLVLRNTGVSWMFSSVR